MFVWLNSAEEWAEIAMFALLTSVICVVIFVVGVILAVGYVFTAFVTGNLKYINEMW